MGTWGTGISSNDTFADVYSEFFDHYDDGIEVPDITATLISKNDETISDPDDANNFWFALAKAQWECKLLDPALLKRVERTIESGADLQIWRGLDASEKDIRKRERILEAFLEKLHTEKPKARTRKKKIIRQPVFEKGVCLTFKLENGNYGGAVVLEAKAMVGFGLNLVAATRINQTDLPEIGNFLAAEVLTLNYATFQDKSMIGWRYSIGFKKEKDLFVPVGKIDISREFDPNDYSAGYSYGGRWKDCVIDVANLQFESEMVKTKPKKSIEIKTFVKSHRWKFW